MNVKDMLNVAILDCPFCGKQPRKSVHGGIVFIQCNTNDCPASHVGRLLTDEIEALEIWNRRAAK